MKFPESLRGKEISLEELGLNENAWKRREALQLLDHLDKSGTFVLGGDVWHNTPDGLRYTYDNWYFEHAHGSASESIDFARSYIQNYPDGDFAFVLVSR